jgi:hypothetical protein
VARVMTPRWTPTPGELVVVWRDNGDALLTTVREYGQSNGGIAVVWVNGIPSYYALAFVRPVTIHDAARPRLQEI